MDLSTIIGYVSTAATLDPSVQITDNIQQSAAINIGQGLEKAEILPPPVGAESFPGPEPFSSVSLPRRRLGTGCIRRINDHPWEGLRLQAAGQKSTSALWKNTWKRWPC